MIESVSHLMAESSIRATDDYMVTCVMYCALVGYASTGKSTGLNLIKKSLFEIEKLEKIPMEQSNLVNSECFFNAC